MYYVWIYALAEAGLDNNVHQANCTQSKNSITLNQILDIFSGSKYY